MAFDWELAGIISRFTVVLISAALMIFFTKKYKKSKEDGPSPNPYYLGNGLFFAMIGFVALFVGITEILSYFGIDIPILEQDFADFDPNNNDLLFLANLGSNPSYLILTIISMIIFAVQIYPLEGFQQKGYPITKLIVFIAILNLVDFIPAIRFTYIHFGFLLAAYLSILMAFMVNVLLTVKIIRNSTGIVKKRSMMNLIGFLLFLVGLVWSMRVGWGGMIGDLVGVNLNLESDVVFGGIVMLIAIYLYWRGFTSGE